MFSGAVQYVRRYFFASMFHARMDLREDGGREFMATCTGTVLPRGLADVLQQVQRGKLSVHLEHQRLAPSVNRLVLGMLTSALFLGSALLWSTEVPPLLGGVSVFGVLGCAVSMVLGLRLLWAIKQSGHLDK